MTTTHRDFDAETSTTPAPPSCTFTLGGREWACRAREDVPFGTVENIFGAYLSGNEGQAVVQIRPFFRSVLIPDQVDAFEKMLDRPDSPLTIPKVGPLIEYVAEEVLNRPTQPAGGSSPGPSRTGRKSTAGSSSRGTRRARSA